MTRSQKELMATKRAISLAKLTELQRQSGRLAQLVADGIVDRVAAADVLLDAALANGLIEIHGDDYIHGMFAAAFEWGPVGSASMGSAA